MNPEIRDTIDREIRKRKTSLERMLLRCIRHAHANWKKMLSVVLSNLPRMVLRAL